jgi:hypothetical protein
LKPLIYHIYPNHIQDKGKQKMDEVAAKARSLEGWLSKHVPIACRPLSWSHVLTKPAGLPQQLNSYDCGPFVLKYMDCLGAGK